MSAVTNDSHNPLEGLESIANKIDLLAAMSADFANTLNVDATLMSATQRITDMLHAEAGAVFILEEQTQLLTCQASCGATEITGLKLQYGQGIVGSCVAENKGRIVRDVQHDPNFYVGVDEQTGFTTKSILCAPLSVKDRCLGAIELVNKRGEPGLFDETDLRMLEALAASAALAILNARMAKALVEQERVKRELELASRIQRSLLPKHPNPDFLVHGVNRPAREVSGDFYDYFSLPDGRVYFALGDVSGKGMNAALMMAKTASLFRCLGKTVLEPGRLMERINNEICETTSHGMFVTMVCGLIDPRQGPDRGLIRIANAGHEPPLLYDGKGSFKDFPADAPPLGILPVPIGGGTFNEVEISAGDGALYIFTDGLTEAHNALGEMLGATGAMNLFSQIDALSLEERMDKIVETVTGADIVLHDDVTVLIVDGRQGNVASISQAPKVVEADLSKGERVALITIPGCPKGLKLVRSVVRQTLEAARVSPEVLNDVVLAVDEACQNVVRHAYQKLGDGDLDMEIRRDGSDLIFLLRDYAFGVDPAAVKPRDLDDIRPGGLGTHLIREVMDEVEFLTPKSGSGNLLRMVKKLDSDQKGEVS